MEDNQRVFFVEKLKKKGLEVRKQGNKRNLNVVTLQKAQLSYITTALNEVYVYELVYVRLCICVCVGGGSFIPCFE